LFDYDDGGFHFFEDESGHVRVLGCDAFRRVISAKGPVCGWMALSARSTLYFFYAHFDVPPAADASRVNQRTDSVSQTMRVSRASRVVREWG